MSLFFGIMIVSFVGCSPSVDTEKNTEEFFPNDSLFRITDAQVFGTHNSYHLAPSADGVAEWNYSHPPLGEQLDRGLRQFELDIVFEPSEQELLVQHIPYIDYGSHCYRFVDCLHDLKTWSDAHPSHFPIQVLIEPKDEVATWSVEGHFDEVDEAILSIWGDRLVTPSMLQGDADSVRESVLQDGWPTLEHVRGHAIFVLLDRGTPQREYTRNLTDISDRVMFPLVDNTHDFAAYFLRDDPFDEGIASLVEDGFLVRTRGDAGLLYDDERLQAAIHSGAHSISVDTDQSLGFIHTQNPVQCNPFADALCRPEDLE